MVEYCFAGLRVSELVNWETVVDTQPQHFELRSPGCLERDLAHTGAD